MITLVISLVGCSKSPTFDDTTWTMTTVQSNQQNGDIVFYNPSADVVDIAFSHPNALPIELVCNANSGTFTITDVTNSKTYTGNYSLFDDSAKATTYSIEIGETKGTAVVSTTTHSDGTEVPTLIISVGDYTLNFKATIDN